MCRARTATFDQTAHEHWGYLQAMERRRAVSTRQTIDRSLQLREQCGRGKDIAFVPLNGEDYTIPARETLWRLRKPGLRQRPH